MTWAFVHAAGAEASVVGTTGEPATLSVTAGHTLIICTAQYVSTDVRPFTITDTQGLTWTKLGDSLETGGSGSNCNKAIFAAVAASTSSTTFTSKNAGTGAAGYEITVLEFSGGPASIVQDGTAQTANSGATTVTSYTSPSITTTDAAGLLIEYMVTGDTGAIGTGWSSGFVNNGDPVGYQLNTSAGTYAASFTNTTAATVNTMLAALASTVPSRTYVPNQPISGPGPARMPQGV